MDEQTQKYAMVAGAVGTIALVVLALKNAGGGASSGGGSNVPVVLREVTNNTVALRGQKTQTDIATIGAKVEALKTFASLQLGLDSNLRGERVALDTNATGERVTKYVSDNDLAGRKVESVNMLEGKKVEGETNRFVSQQLSFAEQEKARYGYEAVHQQAKSQRVAAVSKSVSDIVSGFLKFL